MQVILYISVAVIAAAFTILVVYLIKTLNNLSETLQKVSGTLENVDSQLKGVTKETEELLKKTNELATDLQIKSTKLNTVVDAVKEVGDTVQQFNSSLKSVSNSVVGTLEENKAKISQIIQIGNIAVELKDKWDEIRLRRKNEKLAAMKIND